MTDTRDWIAAHAYRTPDAVAQIDTATGRTFSYRQMHERVSRIAGHLRQVEGLAVGDVVAVLGPNSSDVFDIDFACGRVGAIFLPMNTRLAAPEVAFQLTDAKPKVLLVGSGFESLAAEAIAEAGLPIRVISYAGGSADLDLEYLAADGPTLTSAEPRKASDGWTLLYSSGTTGRPKGVLHSHGGVTMQAIGNCVPLGLSPRACGLTFLPLFHITGLNIFGHAMFYAGGRQITMDKFDPAEVLRILSSNEFGVTHFAGVPTIFEMIASLPDFAAADLSSVEGAFVGGAPSTKTLLETYAAKGMPLIQGYGLTETGPTLTVLDPEDAVSKLGSAGKTILHVDVRVVDDQGADVAAGEAGEIIARGPSVITRYFNRPDAQETAFLDEWLKTGDVGRFDDDGFLFVMDRKKDMFISGGENVYPAEVEDCIAQLAGVLQVAVIGVADDKWGEVGAACIVKQPGSELTDSAVIAHCEQRIARYKIPKTVRFFDQLPLGGSGKVLKTELRKAF
ncbi:MAG: long-chain fatty acid--CoA ligase [Pseudomonadota bacterium]